MPRAIATLLLLSLLASAARAQEGPPLRGLEDRGLGPTPGQLVARTELQRASGARVRVQWDPASGCPRLVRFAAPLALDATEPDEVVREAIARLSALFGWRDGARLFTTAVEARGDLRIVHLEQRVDDVPVDGAALRLVLARAARGVALEEVLGRAYRDLPVAFTPLPPAPVIEAPRLGPLTILDAGPRAIVTPRPRGDWRVAHEAIEVRGGALLRTLRDGAGALLFEESLACELGRARGRVAAREGLTDAPIADLNVTTGRGRLVTTDAQGRFDADAASLPMGFSGPFERVLGQSSDYPRAIKGDLTLAFAESDPRFGELNVFHHLVETRRFFARYADVPKVAQALRSRTVAVLGMADQNAYAGRARVEVQGQRFDHPLFFGTLVSDSAGDPGVITHERTHALLNALGFTSDRGGDATAIHEGLSDYFAGARTGNSQPFSRSLPIGRHLTDIRVDPEDRHDDPHETGIILAGALWGARSQAGAAIDRLVLAAVPALPGGPSLHDAAVAVLAADAKAGGAHDAVLRRHFVRHGLLPAPGERDAAPKLSVRVRTLPADPAHPDAPGKSPPTYAGDTEAAFVAVLGDWAPRIEVTITATDPEGKQVDLTLSGLEAAGFIRTKVERGAPAKATLTFTSPVLPGERTLTITAQDPAGETSVRVVTVVTAESAPTTPDLPNRTATLRAEVGREARASLATMTGLPGTEVQQMLEAGLVRLLGQGTAGATLVGDELVVRPRPGEEGVHDLRIALRGSRYGRNAILEVAVVVGSGPRIDVCTRAAVPDTSVQDLTSWVALPPGQPAVVEAGEAVELRLDAEPLLPGEQGAADVAPVLSLVSAPAALGATLVPRTDPTRPWKSGSGAVGDIMGPSVLAPPGRAAAALWLSPRRSAAASQHEIVVEARVGGRVARRTIPIIVLPASGNRPPALVCDARAVVASPASFVVGATDPDGDEVTVTVASPAERTSVHAGAEGWRISVRGELPVEVLLLATDAHGAKTLRRVEVVTTAPVVGITDVLTPPRIEPPPGQ